MTRTFATLLLAALVLLPAGKALAAPPEKVSGKMVLDEVGYGLRRYARRDGCGDKRRVEWLKKVAINRDPRVAIALVELVFDGEYLLVRDEAAIELWKRYIRRLNSIEAMQLDRSQLKALREVIRGWWIKNGDDLRRRAAQLPR